MDHPGFRGATSRIWATGLSLAAATGLVAAMAATDDDPVATNPETPATTSAVSTPRGATASQPSATAPPTTTIPPRLAPSARTGAS